MIILVSPWVASSQKPSEVERNPSSAFCFTLEAESAAKGSASAIGGAPAKIAMMIDSGVRPGRAASILMLDNIADVVFFALGEWPTRIR